MSQLPDSPPPPDPDWAFFFDVDGTLLEIAPTPESVVVPDGLIARLEALRDATGGAVALVSGRPISQLDSIFAPLALPTAGLHGMERRDGAGVVHPPPAPAGALARLREDGAALAAAHPGMRLEDKKIGIALHYRGAPDAEADVRAFADQVARRDDGFEALAGKMVMEIRPGGFNKGDAVAQFMAEPPFAGRRPVFVGDDVTDEFGFAKVDELDGVSIHVGADDPSRARWRVPSVPALFDWLGLLPTAGAPA